MERIFFKSPTAYLLGNGIIRELPEHLKKLGIRKCLMVTDSVIQGLGISERVMEACKESGIEFAEYAECLPEPPVSNTYDALKVYKEYGCQGVVGLGGGSSMDVAKAVAMMVTNPGKYEDYVGVNRVPARCAPLVLIPTTAGTGSEVSIFSIMMVEGAKAGVCDQNITAHIALVDPELTLTVPRKVTAATGLDAFCHLLEGYISKLATSMSDMIALEGITCICKYLRKAVADGQNREARYWMSYASSLGGFGPNLVDGCAANHGLAFALGGAFHIGHGLANALMLPYVFPVVAKAELEKMPRLAAAMGLRTEGMSETQILREITQEITNLVKDVGCLIPLSEMGIQEEHLDKLVEETNFQTRVMGHSSYQLTSEEIKAIFRAAL